MNIKTKIAIARPFEGKPQINIPSIIGASSKKPILVRIATTGQRPIEYEAINLPGGKFPQRIRKYRCGKRCGMECGSGRLPADCHF